MAELNFPVFDKTLAKVDTALERKQAEEKERKYLGMSIIGDPCWRKLFYDYRKSEKHIISASGIRAIEDGDLQEDVMAARLRILPEIELHTKDPNNSDNQIGFSLLLGHFLGHCDGIIKGIIEAPKTWHVWEHKSVNESKFNDLAKKRMEKGEKKALRLWDETYFGQAQIYMHEAGLERHYLTVTSPGGRRNISVRTEFNKKIAEDLIEKARVIIFDNWNLPARMSEKREFYKCKWCEFQEICHDGKFVAVNCRTCRYSEPVKDSQFHCHYKEENLENFEPCSNHIYNPALIQAKLIEHQSDCCTYDYNGVKFANCSLSGLPELKGELDFIYTSQQLRDIIYIINIKSNKKEKPKKEKKAWE